MEKVYDRKGRLAGYLKGSGVYDNHHKIIGYIQDPMLLDANGTPIAYAANNVLYTTWGAPWAYYDGRIIRDLSGKALGRVNNSWPGMLSAGLLLGQGVGWSPAGYGGYRAAGYGTSGNVSGQLGGPAYGAAAPGFGGGMLNSLGPIGAAIKNMFGGATGYGYNSNVPYAAGQASYGEYDGEVEGGQAQPVQQAGENAGYYGVPGNQPGISAKGGFIQGISKVGPMVRKYGPLATYMGKYVLARPALDVVGKWGGYWPIVSIIGKMVVPK
jgi:hypothetical protein